MKKPIIKVSAVVTVMLMLAACNKTAASQPELPLPEAVLTSCYEAQNTPAFEYFQHSSIQKFMAMWVKEETCDMESLVWDLESFTPIEMVDHDFEPLRPDEDLYSCTFSDGKDRYGYIIFKYNKDDPSVSNYGVTETTPYPYDLRANAKGIGEALKKTDIDLDAAKASRVYLYDREKKRADQVIRFTDKKGDSYLCFFGDSTFEIEKQ